MQPKPIAHKAINFVLMSCKKKIVHVIYKNILNDCGHSSMVEYFLAKENVAGSTPVVR